MKRKNNLSAYQKITKEPHGNIKYKLKEDRLEVFNKLCEHLKAGNPLSSFKLMTGSVLADYVAMFPDEFVQETLDLARAEGEQVWIDMGRKGTLGLIKNFNPASWIFFMKNMYKWRDRQEIGIDGARTTIIFHDSLKFTEEDKKMIQSSHAEDAVVLSP